MRNITIFYNASCIYKWEILHIYVSLPQDNMFNQEESCLWYHIMSILMHPNTMLSNSVADISWYPSIATTTFWLFYLAMETMVHLWLNSDDLPFYLFYHWKCWVSSSLRSNSPESIQFLPFNKKTLLNHAKSNHDQTLSTHINPYYPLVN